MGDDAVYDNAVYNNIEAALTQYYEQLDEGVESPTIPPEAMATILSRKDPWIGDPVSLGDEIDRGEYGLLVGLYATRRSWDPGMNSESGRMLEEFIQDVEEGEIWLKGKKSWVTIGIGTGVGVAIGGTIGFVADCFAPEFGFFTVSGGLFGGLLTGSITTIGSLAFISADD